MTGYAGRSVNGAPFAGSTYGIILLEYLSMGVLLNTQIAGANNNEFGNGLILNSDEAYITGILRVAVLAGTLMKEIMCCVWFSITSLRSTVAIC